MRQTAFNLVPKKLDGGFPEEQSENSADAAEQEAFYDCLLQQSRAACAESGAHRLFAATRNRTRQHEASDVEASERPDAEYHRVKQRQRLARLMAQPLLIAGDLNARWQVAIRNLLGNNGLRPAQSIGQLSCGDAIG